jgi:tRNA (guanine37-N1)-methyltransferase
LRIDIVTIFTEYFTALNASLIGKAVQRGDITLNVHDLRRWATDVHRTVDDAPFGGGPGMVMKPEPWGEALDAVLARGDTAHPGGTPDPDGPYPPAPPAGGQSEADERPRLVVPTPAGVPFSQAMAAEYAALPRLVFACGRYEGIDARVVEDARTRMDVDEVSIGDYVLPGGESAVLVMVEAVCRLLPGVMGNAQSASDDSFGGGGAGPMAGLVEGPSYTRPRVWRGREVPPVLLSGDHAAIARWRRDCALRRTAANRPDLVKRLIGEGGDDSGRPDGPASATLDSRDRAVLDEAGFPVSGQGMAH